MTRDGKVIIGTEAEWNLFSGFDLVEVTVDITGQVNLENCLEYEEDVTVEQP